jgi:hypothetical protein
MGAREWIFVAVAVLAVYLVFQLIRALQAKEGGETAGSSDDTGDDVGDDEADTGRAADTELPDDAGPATEAPLAARPAPPEDDFGLALEVRQLRRDIAQLREELDAQRGEVSALRECLDGQAQQIEATRAAQRVSPLYGEALALAQRGMPADVIAERCSISVAEAELVHSLSRDDTTSGEIK